jgi:hypothetical protein
MTSGDAARVNFLYTNIGRGHPFYLDGIIECMAPESVGTVTDVFSSSSGLARRTWKLARFLYHSGGRGGGLSALYNRLRNRNEFDRGGLAQRIMGRPLQDLFADDPTPLVIAHPILAAILREKPNLFYQHGEVVAPRESWVRGRHRILVPLPETADQLVAAGFAAENLFVSGLCIEPGLVVQAERAFEARLSRLAGTTSLCGAFFSSGAEPREHVGALASAAFSAVAGAGKALVFARRSGLLAARTVARFARGGRELECARSPDELPDRPSDALLCLYDDRRELNEHTEKLFERFDYFVAPAHERTNWALGLGLPMFVVDPSVGSFPPLNREFLLANRVARVITDSREAGAFGETVKKLRETGELRDMAEAGWRRFEVRGFFNIAEMLQFSDAGLE